MNARQLSRTLLWALLVVLSGLIFAGQIAQADQAANQTAKQSSAIALLQPADPGDTALPRVLSLQDEQLYREIFALQEKGKWPKADKLIGQLTDKRLMGHVLAQRYLHPTAYRSRYKELKAWMADYADHPEAGRIYKLALKRRPKNYKRPQPPAAKKSSLAASSYSQTKTYRSPKRRTKAQRRRVAQIKRQIRRSVLSTRLTSTEKLLATAEVRKLFDQVEIDQGYTQAAAAWFYYGNSPKAYELASKAAKRSGKHVPIAHWTAGLAAWRLLKLEVAAKHFEALALSEGVSGWNAASGAYWAARTHLRLRNPSEMSRWLTIAAQHQRTFYGLLAGRALGLKVRFDEHKHSLTAAMIARLDAIPEGRRAMGLLQIGQRQRAERELNGFNGWMQVETTEALLALAERSQMPWLAFKLGSRLAKMDSADAANQGALDAALYPIPPWQPTNGFKIDRALLYALIRQESSFNPKAKSPDGARGLMQLMPATANFVARQRRFRGNKRNELYEPGLNIELGQRYIEYLLSHERVQGDLFRLAVAYNGGPGNLGKWQRRMKTGDDPLLFLESLPSRESRLFVERVLTNLWMYRMRLDQKVPSLDRIAAGDWPLYRALDTRRLEQARNEQN